MPIIELKYEYADKLHCYYLPHATDAFDSWRWFYIGKHLTKKGKDFRMYPFHPSWKETKTILTAKINEAQKQGIMIAKKINSHYAAKHLQRKNKY